MTSVPLSRRATMMALAAGAIMPVPGSARAGAAMEDGPVVLTVGGLIGAPNRGPIDPKRDRLFDHNNLTFQKAHTFTVGELSRLNWQSVKAVIQGSDTLCKGPLLSSVLDAVSPLGSAKLARLSALDGYAAEIPLSDVKNQQWILAMEGDGRPFAIGNFGPLYSMRQLGPNETKTDEESAKWVYANYYIELTP